MPRKDYDEVTWCRVPKENKAILKRIAKQERRTLNWIIRLAIEEYIQHRLAGVAKDA